MVCNGFKNPNLVNECKWALDILIFVFLADTANNNQGGGG